MGQRAPPERTRRGEHSDRDERGQGTSAEAGLPAPPQERRCRLRAPKSSDKPPLHRDGHLQPTGSDTNPEGTEVTGEPPEAAGVCWMHGMPIRAHKSEQRMLLGACMYHTPRFHGDQGSLNTRKTIGRHFLHDCHKPPRSLMTSIWFYFPHRLFLFRMNNKGVSREEATGGFAVT